MFDQDFIQEKNFKSYGEKKEEVKAQMKIEIPKLLDSDNYQEVLNRSILDFYKMEDGELSVMVLYAEIMHDKELGLQIEERKIFKNISLTDNRIYAKGLRNLVASDFAV